MLWHPTALRKTQHCTETTGYVATLDHMIKGRDPPALGKTQFGWRRPCTAVDVYCFSTVEFGESLRRAEISGAYRLLPRW